MNTFNELGLSEQVLAAVARLGYEQPTPVQEQAIPLVLAGRDLIAAAKTGTGKTAAFSLPAMDGLGHAKGKQGPLMLVVTPTRELAQQIGEVCGAIAASTRHRILTVVGGLSYEPQIKRLKSGVDVLIATPGRLIDLMEQRAVRLGDVGVLVLDEADRMLDMGFWPSVKKIVAATPQTRQTLLFSATIDRSVKESVGTLLRDPAVVEIAHKGETADTVEQYIVRVPHALKPDLLRAVLQERGSQRVMVFARTRSRADAACRRLKRAGFTAEAIHSDRSQNQRRRALDNFAAGTTDVLVATDVLARGIDVEEVSYVVNYDLPTQPEDYVHRIGRTGRAGASGCAISFVSPETESALRDIEKFVKRSIPEMEVPGFDVEEAAAAAAARATRSNARRDPELAQAARELARKERRRAKAREEAREAAQEGGAGAKAARGGAQGKGHAGAQGKGGKGGACEGRAGAASAPDAKASRVQGTSGSAGGGKREAPRRGGAQAAQDKGRAGAASAGAPQRGKASSRAGAPQAGRGKGGSRAGGTRGAKAARSGASRAQGAPAHPGADVRPGRAHRAALAKRRRSR